MKQKNTYKKEICHQWVQSCANDQIFQSDSCSKKSKDRNVIPIQK